MRDPRDFARLATQIADDRKAEDIVVLNLDGRVSFCDQFVICNGTNRRHVRAIAEAILETFKMDYEIAPISTEGFDSARWVLLDFGDIVVHIFDEPMRGFYDLEALWSDAPRMELEQNGEAPRVVSTAG